MKKTTKDRVMTASKIIGGVALVGFFTLNFYQFAQDLEIYNIIEEGTFLSKHSDFVEAKKLQKEYQELRKLDIELKKLTKKGRKTLGKENTFQHKFSKFKENSKTFVSKTKWYKNLEEKYPNTPFVVNLDVGTDLLFQMMDQEDLVMKSNLSRKLGLESPTVIHYLRSFSIKEWWENSLVSIKNLSRAKNVETELELSEFTPSSTPDHPFLQSQKETQAEEELPLLKPPQEDMGGGGGPTLFAPQGPNLTGGRAVRFRGRKQTPAPELDPERNPLIVDPQPLAHHTREAYPILNRRSQDLFEEFREKNFSNIHFQKVRQFLLHENFRETRVTGSHFIFKKGAYTVTVPYRTGEIAQGTLKDGIFKTQLSFTEEMLRMF